MTETGLGELLDMMPTFEGGGASWKSGHSEGGCTNLKKSDPNADKGEGVKNPKILQTS